MRFCPSKCVVSLALLLSILSDSALAKDKIVRKSDIKSITIQYKDGKKTKTQKISCFKTTPGKTFKRQKKLIFSSFKDQIKAATRIRTSNSKKKLAQLKLVNKEGSKGCKASNSPSPTPTPVPDYLRLERYEGGFGFNEAQLLLNRFGFGGTPAEIQTAISTGLEATVNRLLTLVPEPELDAVVADIECDGWSMQDPDAGNSNRTCSTTNLNDFSRSGYRTGLIHRFITSKNQLFQRLAFFLMDERLAVSQSAARDCEKHAIRTYVNSVYRASMSGDYKQYMRDMNNDHLMHLRSLDGGTNRGGVALAPNENYAREFWELGTVAPTGLDGQPVYGDIDIAQAALAFTGWNIDEVNLNGTTTCLASWVPLFHSQGPKVVFIGTPYQATVTNAEELLEATFRHPRAAEHLAEDLWKEFINPFATADQIRELAQIIRDNNYNLLPVMRRLMLSKALYAGASRHSLIKHPLDFIVGFVRTTGFPLYYRNYDGLISRIEQQILNPNTVFGWDVKYLSGQQLQIERWNVLVDYFMNINTVDLRVDYNWSYYDRFVADLHAAGQGSSIAVINRVAADLGVPLNATQVAELDQLMNFYLTRYNCPAQCNGMPYRLIRDNYDTDPSADESGYEWGGQRRIRLLVTALLQLPEAQTK